MREKGERLQLVFQQPWPLLCWCLSLGQDAYPAHFFFFPMLILMVLNGKKNSSVRPNEFINASF